MYIFGYGSLINNASRLLTGQAKEAQPVTVHGLQRYWGKIDSTYHISPLVAALGEGVCNGVLVRVDEKALQQFDHREKGYRRIELDPTQLESHQPIEDRLPVWVYTKADHEPPCHIQPIMQTYVDTVLAGCLAISSVFAKTFVDTTLGWHHPLENDRHEPKYGNHAGVRDEHIARIDQLLAQVRAKHRHGKTE
ncbi:gamma-glutamylcyclotransferase family protein [Photobacterium lutimaris]|uniref:Gamma-glutamylcyclotransferase n=1 Tax=Photobacterium lutimaris TaxID=388278 RepID=A0A2T3J1S7_9GAMM|nr:gamma-glutamylcyclotransferase family protein [Photobacterium lutimaris]PSU35028.1 gamma-glutamylcyclotransferase [Photobacterium lutimaris]TDR77385.1 gamma-glutamyl AIG2-like cyclotransferase [Photobacterium lutimaris]